MKLLLLRTAAFIIGLGLTASLHASGTVDFYVPSKTSVYAISAREVNLNAGPVFVPLALSLFYERDKSLIFFSSLKKDIEEIPLNTFLPSQLVQKLDRNSLLINQSALYLAEGNPRIFKEYPTYASDGVLAVTSIPNNDRLCVLYVPTDKFPGAECVVTDTKTGKDLAAFPLEDVYAGLIGGMTWISGKDVFCIIYSLRGSSCFIIDTQSKKVIHDEQLKGVQYFSMVGSKLILFSKDEYGKIISKEFKF